MKKHNKNSISKEDVLALYMDKSTLYIFALIYMDGKSRSDMLGITEDHYYDEYMSDAWYEDILNHISNCNSELTEEAEKATKILNRFYKNMKSCFEDDEEEDDDENEGETE